MSRRNAIAQLLVAPGALAWCVIAALHLKDYGKDIAKLADLPLRAQAAFKTLYILVGLDWIAIAAIAILAAFIETKSRKTLIVFCGGVLLVQAALALFFMGVFLGTYLMFPATLLLIFGGLWFRNDTREA